jgi:hypothetical protein
MSRDSTHCGSYIRPTYAGKDLKNGEYVAHSALSRDSTRLTPLY